METASVIRGVTVTVLNLTAPFGYVHKIAPELFSCSQVHVWLHVGGFTVVEDGDCFQQSVGDCNCPEPDSIYVCAQDSSGNIFLFQVLVWPHVGADQ